MVSVAARRVGQSYPLRVEQWTTDIKFKADALIKEALSGVGVPETDTREFAGITRVIRRMAIPAERAQVTEKYLQTSE